MYPTHDWVMTRTSKLFLLPMSCWTPEFPEKKVFIQVFIHVSIGVTIIEGPLTSACIQELRPLDEAQVACPGPQSVGFSKAESGVEMIRLQALLTVDGVVATGTMRTVHPDLNKNKKARAFV